MNKNKLVLEIPLSNELEDLALDLESVSNQLSYLSRNTQEESEHMACLSGLALDEYIQGKVAIINSLQEKVLEVKSELCEIVKREQEQESLS